MEKISRETGIDWSPCHFLSITLKKNLYEHEMTVYWQYFRQGTWSCMCIATVVGLGDGWEREGENVKSQRIHI